MKTGVAALVGGIVGGLGLLCFLVAFGTDYWLLASDDCYIDDGFGPVTTLAPGHVDLVTTPIVQVTTAMDLGTTAIDQGTTAVDEGTTAVDQGTTALNQGTMLIVQGTTAVDQGTIAVALVATAEPQTNAADTSDAAAAQTSALEASANPTLPSFPAAERQVDLVTPHMVTEAPRVNLHHEGFFWRCFFQGDASTHVILAVLFTNQPASKDCIHGYLFPLPVAIGPVPHPDFDSAAVFRGFWTVFIIVALVAGLVGGFLLVCAVPFTSPKLYRLGGIFLIIAASLFLLLVVLFVLWMELADMRGYVLQDRGRLCPDLQPEAHYGWSFMLAAAGIPLVLLSGLLFYFISRHLQKDTE
ncbi:transmembrane protein 182-like [Engraulis encrasicolus]|uniref:transmembrane protein 182-like n=1 Tax=Engraulis encrasicolus TaxID=184585 RepID=UPI002FD72DA3